MLPVEVDTLEHFRWEEKTINGEPVQWAGYDRGTMFWLDTLRSRLRKSIMLIRGGVEHDPEGLTKLTCVDAVSSADFSEVIMGLTRLPGISWGVYEGRSFHVDMREYDPLPARWMAFRNNYVREQDLFRRGYGEMIVGKKDDWLYMDWNHAQSFELLAYLNKLNVRPPGLRD